MDCSLPGSSVHGITGLGSHFLLQAINPTIEPPELTQEWGNRLLEGTDRTFVRTRTQEKGAVTPQETDPDLSVSVQESLAEVWVGWGLLQGWGH